MFSDKEFIDSIPVIDNTMGDPSASVKIHMGDTHALRLFSIIPSDSMLSTFYHSLLVLLY